jgi:hypothetical protein
MKHRGAAHGAASPNQKSIRSDNGPSRLQPFFAACTVCVTPKLLVEETSVGGAAKFG